MNAEECEFLAGNELVEIVPNFSDPDGFHLIAGDFGPFEAGLKVRVPVWVALYLKRRHKCQLVAPDWLSVLAVQELIDQENDLDAFVSVPPRFMELAHLLLRAAPDDVPEAARLRTLIQDLWDSRVAKMRTSTTKFLSSNVSHARLDGLTQMEITYARPFLKEASYQLARLRPIS